MGDQTYRIKIKRGTGVPTIPVSAHHQNGDWLTTDIYEGELYQDISSGILYTRNGTDITKAAGNVLSATISLANVHIAQFNVGTGYLILTAPSGFGLRVIGEPVCHINSDGTPFVVGLGGSMQMHNSVSLTDSTHLSFWPGDAIGVDGYWIASKNSTRIVTGDVKIYAPLPITGGGTNARMTFYIDYELFPI